MSHLAVAVALSPTSFDNDMDREDSGEMVHRSLKCYIVSVYLIVKKCEDHRRCFRIVFSNDF